MDEPRIRLEEFPEHLRNTLASPTDPTNLDMRIKAVITKIENLLPRLTKEESDISVLTKWKTSDWGTTNKKDILQTILQRSRRPIIKYISLGPQASSGSTVPLDFPGILERRMFALMTSFDGLILNPSLEEQLKSGMTRVYVQKLRRTCEQELAPLAVPGCVILPTDNDNETRNTPDDPSHLSSTTESCLPIEDTSLACIVDAGVECNVCADLRRLFPFPLPVAVKIGSAGDEGDDKTKNNQQGLNGKKKRKKYTKKKRQEKNTENEKQESNTEDKKQESDAEDKKRESDIADEEQGSNAADEKQKSSTNNNEKSQKKFQKRKPRVKRRR